MIYRPIGNTGMSASVIGLGTEYLDKKPYETVEEVIDTALEQGINMMDLFMPGEVVRQNIGRALKGRRNRVLIQGHIGSSDLNQQYDVSRDRATIQKYFENLLRCLNTDYIDFGMLFNIDSETSYRSAIEGDSLRYALELKKQGYIRAIGASSHNPLIARRVVETGLVDLVMLSINPAFDMVPIDTNAVKNMDAILSTNYEKNLDPDRAAFYRLCEQRGVAITVMKTLAGGKLIDPQHTPFKKPLTVTQCIHYALTRPAVASVLIGCSTGEQVLESVRYLSATEAERDYTSVLEEFQGSMRGSCVYCNHCLPCPAEINIALVNKYLDIARLDEKNIPPAVARDYAELEYPASDCTACGSCEERCPFSVRIIERMKSAAALFEG